MKISFETLRGASRIMNPMKGFSLDGIPFEIRFDPLTGETGRVFDLPFKAEKSDLTDTIRRSTEMFCPFCPETLDRSTPLFPEDLIPEGRIRMGQATLIPNLLPFDKYAGVAVVSGRHYVPMEELTADTLRDSFLASLEFIRSVARHDSLVRYFSINWNYMPPAGSSMVHPHLQPNAGEIPTNELRLQREGAGRYAKEKGRSLWHDLIETEREMGIRYIGAIESTRWVMSFVPLGFLPDVWCIFPDHDSLADIPEDQFLPFLSGLESVLRYFREQNLYSFNVSVFSVRGDDSFRINARICPRLLPRAIGNSDMAYFQALHKEPFCVRRPESVCAELRPYFP
jgi:UDPglucose--hexose-1-phosphate uridylyltransferase